MVTEKEIIQNHPLLFADYGRPISETAISWGLEIGPGWYELVNELCDKLEPLIEKMNIPGQICVCGCSKAYHLDKCRKKYFFPFPKKYLSPNSCEIPNWKNAQYYKKPLVRYIKVFKKYYLWKIKHFFRKRYYRFFNFLYKRFHIGYWEECSCQQYQPNLPRVSQIKEKFGSLHFYMTSATDAMWNLIHEYEKKSITICEECGKEGKLITKGWWKTSCDKCK